MTKKSVQAVAALLLSCACGLAAAQTTAYVRPTYSFPQEPPATGPASVQLGDTPFYVLPSVGAGFGYDDNLFYAHTNEKSSSYWQVTPGIRLDGRDANKVVQVSYQNQTGRYTSSADDNYVDNTARAQFDMAFDPHNFLRLGYDYVLGHDPRGSTDRPISGRPDRYRRTSPFAMYALGAPGAQGRFELYVSDPVLHYLNNREFTTPNDRKMPEFGGAFYVRVAPRTYAMVEARQTDVRYEQPGSPLSAKEDRYYVGVMWEATAATAGTIKVGQLRRNFSNTDQPTFTGTSWEALVTWAPRTYSKLDFYTTRQTNESTGLGNFILTSIAGVTWSHNWTSYVSSGVDAHYQRDEYQGFDRTDKYSVLGLRAGYKFRRWLTFGAEFNHTTRDSNVDTFQYDKNLYLITLTATM